MFLGGKMFSEVFSNCCVEFVVVCMFVVRDVFVCDIGVWVYCFIKKVVLKFSLECGFEFVSIVKIGEW